VLELSQAIMMGALANLVWSLALSNRMLLCTGPLQHREHICMRSTNSSRVAHCRATSC
jgi:hypothetical protein